MSSCEDQDDLLAKAQDRANTAQTMFMLLDSDADGLVAVEQARAPPHRRGGPPAAPRACGPLAAPAP